MIPSLLLMSLSLFHRNTHRAGKDWSRRSMSVNTYYLSRYNEMLFHLLLYYFIFPENCFYNVNALPSKLEKYFCFGKNFLSCMILMEDKMHGKKQTPLMLSTVEKQQGWLWAFAKATLSHPALVLTEAQINQKVLNWSKFKIESRTRNVWLTSNV